MLKSSIIVFVLTVAYVQCDPPVTPPPVPVTPPAVPGTPAPCPSQVNEDKPSLKRDKFDRFDDAKSLCKEITDSWVVDPKEIVQMLCHRNWDERNQIQQTFPEKCDNRVLLDKINHINLMMDQCKDLMAKLLTSPTKILTDAIEAEKNDNHEDDAITMIICSATNKEKTDILNNYTDLPKILDDYGAKGGEGYKTVLTKTCFKQRTETPDTSVTDEMIACAANELKTLNGPEFVAKLKEIIDKYGDPELKRIFLKYTELQQDCTIADKVMDSFEGKEKEAYTVLVRSIQNKYMAYAMILNHCIKGGEFKSNLDCVDRVVTIRCEIDLGNIATIYESLFHKKFCDDFKDSIKIDGLYYEAIRKLFGDYE